VAFATARNKSVEMQWRPCPFSDPYLMGTRIRGYIRKASFKIVKIKLRCTKVNGLSAVMIYPKVGVNNG